MIRIAVLGLGAMGTRMTQHLIRNQHQVVVYNRAPARTAPLAALGAEVAPTPKAAAQQADVVLSMVTDDEASRSVWCHEENGAIAGLSKDALAIESSTVTPSWVKDLAAQVGQTGARFLDAPVVGSRPQADAGQLIYLVGGEPGTLERARPVFDATGGAVHHLGPVGSGAAMKLAVNTLYAAQIAALTELLGSLERAGLSREAVLTAFGALPITSPAVKGACASIAAKKYAPMFPIELVEKDLRYAANTAAQLEANAPLTQATQRVFAQAKEQGFGADNITGVAQLYEG